MTSTRTFGMSVVAVAVLAVTGAVQAISISIPNGSFEAQAVNWYGPGNPNNWLINYGGAVDPGYSIYASGSPDTATDGAKYLRIYPGRVNGMDGTTHLITGRTDTLSSTGITDTVIAGKIYQATVSVGENADDWNPGDIYRCPIFTVSLLDNGIAVATGALVGGDFGFQGSFRDAYSLAWTAPAGSAGDSLQIRVSATGFYGDADNTYNSTHSMYDNARLAIIPEPGALALLGLGALGLVIRRGRRLHA